MSITVDMKWILILQNQEFYIIAWHKYKLINQGLGNADLFGEVVTHCILILNSAYGNPNFEFLLISVDL